MNWPRRAWRAVARDLRATSWDEWETFAWRIYIISAVWFFVLAGLTPRLR